MYLLLKKIKQIDKPWGKETVLTHIGLYMDDGTYVKFVPHDGKMLEKIQGVKIDITLPEVEEYLKEHEKLKVSPPPPPGLFDNIPLKGFTSKN